MLVAVGWAAYALPLTRVPWINAYALISLTTAGSANLVYVGLKGLVRQLQSAQVANDTAAGAALTVRRLPAVCRLRLTVSLRYRLRLALSGAALALNLVAVVAAFTVGPRTLSAPDLNDLYRGVLGIEMLVSVVGLALFVAALTPRHFELTADQQGLTERHGRRTTTIAWDNVATIRAERGLRGIAQYVVLDADGRSSSWRSEWESRPRAYEPDAVSGDELAAAVCQRVGKSLRMEET